MFAADLAAGEMKREAVIELDGDEESEGGKEDVERLE